MYLDVSNEVSEDTPAPGEANPAALSLEFERLTDLCNTGEASAEEYERWCELRDELSASDLTARRVKERRFLRVEIDLDVEIRIGERTRVARCLELGAGGMKLEVPEPLEGGGRAVLTFRLPGDPEVWCLAGHVAWTDPDTLQCGVQFDGLSCDVVDELRAAVIAEHVLRPLTRPQ